MSDTSRRKLLKSIAAGSGAIVAGKSLPETWSRPVVDSVLLPAHAQTSGSGAYSATGVAHADDLLGILVPSALANNLPKNICINVNAGIASVQVQYGGPVYSGSGPVPFNLKLTPSDANSVSITGSLDTKGNSITGKVTAGGSTSPYTAPAIPTTCSLMTTLPAPTRYTFLDTGETGLDVRVPLGTTQVKVTCIGGQGGGGGGSYVLPNTISGFSGGGGGGGGASAVIRSGSLITFANGGDGGDGDGLTAGTGPGNNGLSGATTMTTVFVTVGEILTVRAALGGYGGVGGEVYRALLPNISPPAAGGAGSGGGSDADIRFHNNGAAGGIGSVTTGGSSGAGDCALIGEKNGQGGAVGLSGHCGAAGSVTLEWL